MGRHRRVRRFSDEELAIVWRRWREGALVPDIGRELGRVAPGDSLCHHATWRDRAGGSTPCRKVAEPLGARGDFTGDCLR